MSGAPDLGGYVAAIAYPSRFIAEASPGWLAGRVALAGRAGPRAEGGFRLLDLGCGDGIGLALSAASHPQARIEGVDGNPAHIARGTAFAHAAGIDNLVLRAATFAEMAGGAACDFVTALGVIAWVDAATRAQVFDIAAARLAPGGVFAVSYNTLPGWSDRLVLQALLRRFGAEAGGGPVAAFDAALARVAALAAAGEPGLPRGRIAELQAARGELDPAYFPHEYLNAHWRPLAHGEVRAAMAARGLDYVGQAHGASLRPDLTLGRAARAAWGSEPDAAAREALVDAAVNRAFRCDLYQRPGGAGVAPVWLMAAVPGDARLQAQVPGGRLGYATPAARGVLAALQSGPRALEDLGALAPEAALRDAVDCLLIGGQVWLCAPPTGAGAGARTVNAMLAAAGTPPVLARAGGHGAVASPRDPAPAERLRWGPPEPD